jgi:hypothetical protein
LNICNNAGSVQFQESSRQLPQIVSGRPNGQLASAPKYLRYLDQHRGLNRHPDHFGDCKPGEFAH